MSAIIVRRELRTREYIATSRDWPSLSWIDTTPRRATNGLRTLILIIRSDRS